MDGIFDAFKGCVVGVCYGVDSGISNWLRITCLNVPDPGCWVKGNANLDIVAKVFAV